MPCEICGYAIVQKHRIVPGAWGGKYEPGNVARICPNHHEAIHFLMRWYLRPSVVATTEDCDRLSAYFADAPLVAFWADRVKPVVVERVASHPRRVAEKSGRQKDRKAGNSPRPPKGHLEHRSIWNDDALKAMSCAHDHVEDHSEAELRESAYRRGFNQALAVCLPHPHGYGPGLVGVDLGQVDRWMSRINDWRYRMGRYDGSRAKVMPPPEPPWRTAHLVNGHRKDD